MISAIQGRVYGTAVLQRILPVRNSVSPMLTNKADVIYNSRSACIRCQRVGKTFGAMSQSRYSRFSSW
jgi:hypothetical protein